MRFRVTHTQKIVRVFEVNADSAAQAHVRVDTGPIEEVYLKEGVRLIDAFNDDSCVVVSEILDENKQ